MAFDRTTDPGRTFKNLGDTPSTITALNYVRGDAAGTDLEFRTTSEVLSDIGAAIYTAGSGLGLSANEFTLDLGGLDDDTGHATADTSGWSTGDFLAMVESGGTEKKIKPSAEIGVAVSDETTTLSTGDDQITFLVPRNMTITEVKASLSASDSSGVDIDVRYHATDPGSASTIFASDLSIGSSAYYGTKAGSTVFVGSAASKAVDANGFLVVDINNVSDATGLKLWVLGYWT